MSFQLFGQGAFSIDPNSSPEQLARRRQLLESIMGRASSAQYAGQGLANLATGILAGRQNRQADRIESTGTAGATAAYNRATAGGQGGFSILGALPPDPVTSGPIPDTPQGVAGDAMAALGHGPGADIRAALIARGLPPHVADGFIMNFRDESGLDPSINERNPTVPGSRGGYGLAQWTGPRRQALEAYAAQRGLPVSDIGLQADFLMTELQGPEAAAAREIMSTSDAPSAAAAIAQSYLRPAPENLARRVADYTGQGGVPAQPGIDQQAIYDALSNPWISQEQRAVLTDMLDQYRQNNDPLRLLQIQQAQANLSDTLNPSPDAMSTASVQSATTLDDGTIVYAMTDGSRIVRGPAGDVLEGQAAADAIRTAREYTVENQTDIAQGRRTGTLNADIGLGGEAAGSVKAGEAAIGLGQDAWASYGKLQSGIANIDEAIAAIDAGARSGAIERYFPNISEQSASLRNAMDRMGLDIISATTFGALSEGELRLAMDTAVPRNLDEPALRAWLVRRRDAQSKVAAMLADSAQFLSTPGNTLAGWIAKNRGAAVPTGDTGLSPDALDWLNGQ